MVAIFEDRAVQFWTGRKSSIGTSQVQLTTTTRDLSRGVQIKAAAANTGTVYVGNTGVTVDADDGTDGFPLAAGEGLLVQVDDPTKVYLIASAAGQKVFFFAV